MPDEPNPANPDAVSKPGDQPSGVEPTPAAEPGSQPTDDKKAFGLGRHLPPETDDTPSDPSPSSDDPSKATATSPKLEDTPTKTPADGAKMSFEAQPDWCPDECWDPETMEVDMKRLGDRYSYFRGIVSKGMDKVPKAADAYRFEVPEAIKERFKESPETWDPTSENSDPLLRSFLDQAHSLNLTHHQVAQLVPWYLTEFEEYQNKYAPPIDEKEELRKLGHGGDALIKHTNTIVREMDARGFLDQEESIEMDLLLGTAAGVRALAKTVEYLGGPSMPTQINTAVAESASASELSRKLGELMDKPNPTKAELEEINEQYKRVYGTAPAGAVGRPGV